MEDFISRVVSESEDIGDVKKLALQINKIGSKMADSSESYRNTLTDLEKRMIVSEDNFEVLVEKIMDAPPGTVNTSTLNIRRQMTSSPPLSTPAMISPQTPMATSSPNLQSATAIPTTPGPNISGPNLKAAPASPSPNLSAPPAGPDLNAPAPGGPNLNAAPPSGGGSEPNLNVVPVSGSSGSITDALANLKEAPQNEPAVPSASSGGLTAGNIQNALAGLTKAPVKEKEGSVGGFGGFNPAEALKNLKKAPRSDEKEEENKEESTAEFAFILQKRRQASEEVGVDGKGTKDNKPKELSAEEMKSQLQSKLKQAFKT